MDPCLTVVVPVYNVEQYLEECLTSIAAQTLPDLDVVMVDDGSTDAGPEIAEAWTARDPRFRLVRQDNGGLGHARNTGARHADPRTAYLTFADSDDVLPPQAYEKLVALLDRSGSDFASGNVYRLTAHGRSQAWQHRGMSTTVTRTHITRDLSLLSDRVAWNKVFRRTFWNKHGLAFPEGVLYEDTPLTIPAHFLADAVDVLHEHVYYWRIREGSITRRRTDVRGVRDRIAAVDGVSRFLADPAASPFRSPSLVHDVSAYKRDYDRSVLTDDLLYFMEALPMAGPEYHRVFMDRARDFLSRVDPALDAELPVELRMRWRLIREGRLADLLTVLDHEKAGGRVVFDLAGPPLRKRATLPRPDGTPVPLPRAAAAVGTKDLPVTARLREVEWRDGKVILKGYAYIRNVDARSRRSSLKTAVAMSGRRKLLLPVRTVAVPEVTSEGRQERHCYDWSGFEITVDPRRLRRDGRWQPGQWRIGIVIASGSLVRPAALRADDAGAGSSPVPFPLDADTRLVPWYKDGRLHLSVEAITRRLTGHHHGDDGGSVVLELAVRDRKPPVALRVRQQVTGAVLDYPLVVGPPGGEGGSTATAEVRPADPGHPPTLEPHSHPQPPSGDGWSTATPDLRPAEPGHPPTLEPHSHPQPPSGDGWSTATPDLRPAEPGHPPTLEPHSHPQPPSGDGWSAATATVRLADLVAVRPAMDGVPKEVAPETTATWAAEVLFEDGGSARVAVDGPLAAGCYGLGPDERLDGTPRELALDRTAAGNLILRDRTPGPLADTVSRTAAGRLRVEGELPSDAAGHRTHGDGSPVQLVLRHGTFAAEVVTSVTVDGPRFSVEQDVSTLPHAGRWYLHLRAAGRDTPVRIAHPAMDALPLDLSVPASAEDRTLQLNRRFHDHLYVSASDTVPAADRGPYRQRLLRERRYPVLARRPLQPAVLYSSFDGRDCGDSPRAVHEELVRRGAPLDHVWVVRDRAVAVPASARAVLHGSHAWYEALARSRYVVTNTHLPAWFRRRDGQRVVQTWHGTPVKRIGLDLEGTLCADLTHMWPQPRRAEQWSVLLSPNAHSTPVLRRALHHDGDLAETGLPRTDLLAAADRDKVAEQVRARLGVPTGRTVVLYAPTIRDDQAYDADHHRLHLPVDLAAMEAELSDSHVLLIRAHPLVADTVSPAAKPVRVGAGAPRADAEAGPQAAGTGPTGADTGRLTADTVAARTDNGRLIAGTVRARPDAEPQAAGTSATGSGTGRLTTDTVRPAPDAEPQAAGTSTGTLRTDTEPPAAGSGTIGTDSVRLTTDTVHPTPDTEPPAAGTRTAPTPAPLTAGGNRAPFVRDVSAHPDLAELLLAADVLVTDYSAVMADFAVTGRPILLYAPDLAHYRDTLRGFSFDYEERAPGPVLRSTGELIEALRDPEAAVRPREAAYAAFRAAFCHLDDGHAAARVADLMLH